MADYAAWFIQCHQITDIMCQETEILWIKPLRNFFSNERNSCEHPCRNRTIYCKLTMKGKKFANSCSCQICNLLCQRCSSCEIKKGYILSWPIKILVLMSLTKPLHGFKYDILCNPKLCDFYFFINPPSNILF